MRRHPALQELDELEDVHALRTELAEHVRREQRELFPLIEQALPEPELVALSKRLAPSSSR